MEETREKIKVLFSKRLEVSLTGEDGDGEIKRPRNRVVGRV